MDLEIHKVLLLIQRRVVEQEVDIYQETNQQTLEDLVVVQEVIHQLQKEIPPNQPNPIQDSLNMEIQAVTHIQVTGVAAAAAALVALVLMVLVTIMVDLVEMV